MRKLSDPELKDFVRRLSQWQVPHSFGEILEEAEAIAGFLAVGDGRMKVWREGFVAMSCAQLSLAARLRLGNDPPDFELDYGDHVRSFELVDLIPKGRQRTGEFATYARLANAGDSVPIEHIDDAEEQLELLPGHFEEQVAAKAAKGYPPGLILVVDVQYFLIARVDEPVERHLAQIARKYLAAFSEIWIRRGASIIRVTPHGESRMITIRPQED